MRRPRHSVRTFLAATLVVGLPAVGSADVITPENGEFDAGVICLGDFLAHTFRVKNVFGAPYRIARVESNGMRTDHPDAPSYAPGQDIQIRVTMSPQWVGVQSQKFYVVPVDSQLPTLCLTVWVRVLDRLTVSPSKLTGQFDRLRIVETSAELSVSIVGDLNPVHVVWARASPPMLDCAVAPVEGDLSKYRVTVRAGRTAPSGRHVGFIELLGTLDMASGNRPVVARTPFDVEITGGLWVHPPAVWFALLRPSDRPRLSRYLTVELWDGAEFLSASSRSEFVGVVEKHRDSRRVVLEVSLVEDRLPRGRFSASVDVRWRKQSGPPQTVTVEVGGHVLD